MLQLYVRGDRSNEEFVICVYVKKEKMERIYTLFNANEEKF